MEDYLGVAMPGLFIVLLLLLLLTNTARRHVNFIRDKNTEHVA